MHACMQASRNMLKGLRIDKVLALQYVAAFFADREHLLERATMFLAKAFVIYKVGAVHKQYMHSMVLVVCDT
jgi:hypothetical protein